MATHNPAINTTYGNRFTPASGMNTEAATMTVQRCQSVASENANSNVTHSQMPMQS